MMDVIKFKAQYGTFAAARLLRARGVCLKTALTLLTHYRNPQQD